MSNAANTRCPYTQNRELSWLRFDQRVLEEAADPAVPPLERLKFVSIFTSNLDEFFMVRVGSLFDIARMSPEERDSKTGMTARDQLRAIYRAVPGLLERKKRIYAGVMEELDRWGIRDMDPEALTAEELKRIWRYFKTEMTPVLSPIVIGPHHPVPHLVGKRLYAALLLQDKKGRQSIGIVPMPDRLDPYVMLADGRRFVRGENILLRWAGTLFGEQLVRESCLMCVTRNADISFDDEKFEDDEEDFRRHMSKLLKKRDHLSAVRLELDRRVSPDFAKKLAQLAGVEDRQVFADPCPLNMGYVFKLIGTLPREVSVSLLYPPYEGRWPENLDRQKPIRAQVEQQDKLLFYPYDSVEPFLLLLSQAAEDPEVLSVKITIYRLASPSKVARILCRAAENGKDVLVLMELRARFDEAHNLAWAKQLEEAGCQVIYGMEGFKCHSKVCLITTRSRGKTGYLTQIGTGNYNEKTNAMYTDLCLMTADQAIGEDAAAFFRNMLVNDLEGKYRQLRVSPFGIREELCRRIDGQAALGREGYICIKANSVTHRAVIDRLCKASQAGTEVRLIIRGICCILPGVPGYTDNIHITSVVGRYLEHARVYVFGRGEQGAVYLSSADLMTRNLDRRVEIACPVHDPQLKQQLRWMLESQLRDNVKASDLLPDGTYARRHGAVPFDCQNYFMEQSPHTPPQPQPEKKSLGANAAGLLHRFFHAPRKKFQHRSAKNSAQ